MGTILLESVGKTFRGGVRAVDGVSLEVADGEFMVLVGPSGCGKTTLLRMIAGLEEVTEGRILIGGRDATRARPAERDIAMVFQNYALYPHLSVRRNIGYGLKMRKVPSNEIERRVLEVARMLAIEPYLDRRPAELSGGQRQRVAMGRAIARNPEAFLMDEPLSNLDAQLRGAVRTELARLHARLGVTTVFVTHDQVEAMTLGQRAAVMRDGRIQQVGTPQELYSEPNSMFVARFLGSPAINLFHGTVDEGSLQIGSFTLPLSRSRSPERSGSVVVGIRPEHVFLGEMAGEPGRVGLGTCELELVEELGSRADVHFWVDAPSAAGLDDGSTVPEHSALREEHHRTLMVASVDPRQLISGQRTVEVFVDPATFHYFDPESHVRLKDRGPEAVIRIEVASSELTTK
jgi:multiple sugar transport system ATP-binding protein